jgi:hypothetical protein
MRESRDERQEEDVRTSARYLFNDEAIIIAGEGQKFTPKYYKGKFDLHQRTYAILELQIIGKFLILDTILNFFSSHSPPNSLNLSLGTNLLIIFPPQHIFIYLAKCKFVDFPFKAKSSAMKILLAREKTNIKFIYEAIQTIKYEVGNHERHWISKFYHHRLYC